MGFWQDCCFSEYKNTTKRHALMNTQNTSQETSKNTSSDSQLAVCIARRAMKIVVFIGMASVVLLMINIYILLNQITATAQMSREIKTIKQVLENPKDSNEVSSVESSQAPNQSQSKNNLKPTSNK